MEKLRPMHTITEMTGELSPELRAKPISLPRVTNSSVNGNCALHLLRKHNIPESFPRARPGTDAHPDVPVGMTERL